MATQPLSSEVVHHVPLKPPVTEEATAMATTTPNSTDLIRFAIERNANVEQLTKLMDLIERGERRQAKHAFDAAMKLFKEAAPRITKNHHVHFDAKDRSKGPTDYKHATLDHVCNGVIGELAKVGISHRWKVAQQGEWITVTCILTHELGHAEETSLMGCPDNTGNKNSIQAVGSTVTYLQRYTLLAATGLATTEQDDDGRGGATIEAGIPQKRVDQICAEIAATRSEDELRTRYFAAYHEAERADDPSVIGVFLRTKDQRKRELLSAARNGVRQ